MFGSYHNVVDYLDYMYERQILMMSGKPRPIVSYDTIIHPFDFHTWLFTFILIFVEFSLLLVMQNLWSHATGKPKPSDYIFQGLNWNSLSRFTNSHERFFRLLPLKRTLDSKRGIQNTENINPKMVVLG